MSEPKYQTYPLFLQPGDSIKQPFVGDFVECVEASADLKIKIGTSPPSTFKTGIQYRSPVEFSSVEIINPNDVPVKVEMALGAGGIHNSAVKIDSGTTVKMRPEVPDLLNCKTVEVPANTTRLIAAQNSLRKEIIVSRSTVETGVVYLHGSGDAPAASSRGVPVLPGASIVLETTASVYCSNDTAGSFWARVAEMEFSS